jgi:hypothetical protein
MYATPGSVRRDGSSVNVICEMIMTVTLGITIGMNEEDDDEQEGQ